MAAVTHGVLPSISNENRQSVANQLYDILLARIVKLELRPFTPLSEKKLGEEYQVSRTPVREALTKLAALEFVDIYPQRGTYVSPIRLGHVFRAQFMREAVEMAIVRAATRRSNTEFVAELRNELKVQRAAKTVEEFYQSDEAFHCAIAEHAGLEQVWIELRSIKLHMNRFRYLSLPNKKNVRALIAEHARIVRGIGNKDPLEASEAMRAHIRHIFADAPEILAKHKDLFDPNEDFDLDDYIRGLD